MFVDFVRRRLGMTPRIIAPADLRLVRDPQVQGTCKLCCVAKHGTPPNETIVNYEGEFLEEIHQVGLELYQRELRAVHPEMLRQISLRCFNDLRTILLVHDKRMLGIVRQELHSLVARGVISPSQAYSLDKGIIETILPGSNELGKFLQCCRTTPELQAEYILKPIRSAKGAGIVFGDAISSAEWIARLEGLRCPSLGTACVVQRKVHHVLYDVVLSASGTRTTYPLVGTYHSIDGQFLGLGTWRSSPDRICAISNGAAWICSVMEGDSAACR
jgi:hypothetical protein